MHKNLSLTSRNLIYKVLYILDLVFRRRTNIIILCYHAIDEGSRFSTKLIDFKNQIAKIERTHTAISLSDLFIKIKNKDLDKSKKYFVVTFDDGYKSVLKVVKFLGKKDIKPTISLIQDHNNVKNNESNIFLTQNDILLLIKAGWEIANHTKTHRKLSELNMQDVKIEVKRPSSRVKAIAYPLGRYTSKVLKEVKKQGYQIGLTMDDGFIDQSTNMLTLPRVGVDATHDISIFESIYSPSVISFRRFLKNSPIKDLFINI